MTEAAGVHEQTTSPWKHTAERVSTLSLQHSDGIIASDMSRLWNHPQRSRHDRRRATSCHSRQMMSLNNGRGVTSLLEILVWTRTGRKITLNLQKKYNTKNTFYLDTHQIYMYKRKKKNTYTQPDPCNHYYSSAVGLLTGLQLQRSFFQSLKEETQTLMISAALPTCTGFMT